MNLNMPNRQSTGSLCLHPKTHRLYTVADNLKRTERGHSDATSLHRKINDLETEKKELLLEQYYNDLVNSNLSSHGSIYYDKTILSEDAFAPQMPALPLIASHPFTIRKTT